MVGLEELAYAGNHGLELLPPGAEEPSLDPAVADRAAPRSDFVLELDADDVSAAQPRLEDKGPIQALHWREAADQERAREAAERIAAPGRERGPGPPLGAQGARAPPRRRRSTRARRSSACWASARSTRALFGGDDRTDLDAFAALREMANAGAAARRCLRRRRLATRPRRSSPNAPTWSSTGPTAFSRC